MFSLSGERTSGRQAVAPPIVENIRRLRGEPSEEKKKPSVRGAGWRRRGDDCRVWFEIYFQKGDKNVHIFPIIICTADPLPVPGRDWLLTGMVL